MFPGQVEGYGVIVPRCYYATCIFSAGTEVASVAVKADLSCSTCGPAPVQENPFYEPGGAAEEPIVPNGGYKIGVQVEYVNIIPWLILAALVLAVLFVALSDEE